MAARKHELNVLGGQKQLQFTTENLVSRIPFFLALEQKTEQLATVEFFF